MVKISIGDLIRWRNPLYVASNRPSAQWHHALIVSLTKREVYDCDGHRVEIELLFMGNKQSSVRFNVTLEFLHDVGEIQKLLDGEWATLEHED